MLVQWQMTLVGAVANTTPEIKGVQVNTEVKRTFACNLTQLSDRKLGASSLFPLQSFSVFLSLPLVAFVSCQRVFSQLARSQFFLGGLMEPKHAAMHVANTSFVPIAQKAQSCPHHYTFVTKHFAVT